MSAQPGSGTDSDVAELIDRTAEAADAWMKGDMERYLDLVRHASGFTLTAPNGGPPAQFADRRSEFRGWQSPFRDGAATLEITAVHAWGDTAILVMIERQHGRIGDQPNRDLSMRVTQIYRRTASRWELVHRHADPLVRTLTTEQLEAISRGD